jgi:hypothetical protein
MHEGHPVLLLQRQRVRVRIGVAVAMQHHLAAQRLDRIDLHLRRGHRHHDHCAASQLVRRQRHPLRVIARRRADHAALELRGRELGHLVVGPAQLEAEHRLLVFALEQHLVVQAPAQGAGGVQR